MSGSVDHYAVLGVDPTADKEAIRRAWIDGVKANHPDRLGDEAIARSIAEERIRRINDAWSVLGDDDRRRDYDRERAADLDDAGVTRSARPSVTRSVAIEPRRGFSGGLVVAGLLAVLLAIVILSAYATSRDDDPSQTSTTSSVPPVTGSCVAISPSPTGLLAEAVDCTGPNSGRVVAIVDTPRPCPSGTTARELADHRTTLCVAPT